jgi:hypothetical protein
VIYSVQWSRTALDATAEFWLRGSSPERTAVSRAVETVDRLLRHYPGERGESRDAGERVMFEPPLVVTFKVDDTNRVVRVVGVRLIKHRG